MLDILDILLPILHEENSIFYFVDVSFKPNTYCYFLWIKIIMRITFFAYSAIVMDVRAFRQIIFIAAISLVQEYKDIVLDLASFIILKATGKVQRPLGKRDIRGPCEGGGY